MKISLFYCGMELGWLEKTEKGFSYTSNIEVEQEIREERIRIETQYKLWSSIEREEKNLFLEFEHILMACRRSDIVQDAGIDSNDSRWDKLVKLSKLRWFPQGFYVQQCKQEDDKN